jgi:hypothetical protein
MEYERPLEYHKDLWVMDRGEEVLAKGLRNLFNKV